MIRTVLTLMSLSLVVACAPEDMAVEAGVSSQERIVRTTTKDVTKNDDVTLEDTDGDGKPDKANYPDGSTKDIAATTGDGSITCGVGQDDCVERPLIPMGMQSFSANSRLGHDLVMASSANISRSVFFGSTAGAEATFDGAPDAVAAVYTLENNATITGRFGRMTIRLEDSVLIETTSGKFYETEPGAVSGAYTFVD